MDEETNTEWMTSLPKELRDLSIINIAIPGSHNSMTYGISRNSKCAPDAEPTVRRLYRIVPWFVRRWAKTQKVNVFEQLQMGVRYFDLRICQKDNKYYYVHGLYAMELFEPLSAIRDFVDAHAGEVILLDFQHNYAMNVTHHMKLHAELLEFFGDRLYTPLDGALTACTLNRCEKLRKQILIIYRRSPIMPPKQFWLQSSMPTPWPNVASTQKLVTFLENALQKRTPIQGYISQCLITPTTRFVCFRFCSSLRRTAKRVDRKIIPWVEAQSPGPFDNGDKPTVNIFIADFIDLKNGKFCELVIALNAKITPTAQNESSNDEAAQDNQSFSND